MSHVEVPHHVANDEHKRVGIFISVLAVLMALVSSLARNQANEIIVKEVQASNGFAWYQAKRQRSHLNDLELQRAEFELAGNPTEAQRKVVEMNKARLKSKNAEYEKENEVIRTKAEADKDEARLAEHKHHWLEYGEICMHIAVVLCSLTLLTDMKLFFRLGIAATIAGILVASIAFFPHAVRGAELHGSGEGARVAG